MMDERALIREAAEAVAHAARPGLLAGVRSRSVSWPTEDLVADAEVMVRSAMEGGWHQVEAGPFWDATGGQLTASLCVVVRGLDEVEASYLVGAALHAHVLGGADVVPDSVLRLAERAACWRLGVDHPSFPVGN